MSNITKKKLIKDVFKLNESEYKVFRCILDSPGRTPISIKRIITKFPKDRSTIQKIIKILLNNGLIIKRQQNLNRGFRFLYQSIDKHLLIMTIETYYKQIEQEKFNLINRWKMEVENE